MFRDKLIIDFSKQQGKLHETHAKREKKTGHNRPGLEKGLPLAGLLSSLVMTTGCDLFRAVLPRQTVGDVPMQKPSQVNTPEQPEEPNTQPTQNQLPDTPVEEKSNTSEAQSLGSQITTGDSKLPIITIFNDEQKDKILEIINPDTITDPSKLQPRASDPMKPINK